MSTLEEKRNDVIDYCLFDSCYGCAIEDDCEKYGELFEKASEEELDKIRAKIPKWHFDEDKDRLPHPYELYRHFKGNLYVIVGIATHTETGQMHVIYRNENEMLVSPFDAFFSEVDHEKYPDVEQKYRFERC